MTKATNGHQIDMSAIHLLHRAGQCADELFAMNTGKTDLTPRQFAVLSTVAKAEDVSQTALVDATGIDRSTLADIVRRMLKKGLLQRRRTKEDARAYAVKLTDEGWKMLKSADPLSRKVDDRILSSLPNAQRERFMQDLNSIVQILGKLQTKEAASKR